MKKALLFKRALRVSLVFLFLGSYALAAEPRRITFGYYTIGPMAAGAWMAKDIGAFEKYGTLRLYHGQPDEDAAEKTWIGRCGDSSSDGRDS